MSTPIKYITYVENKVTKSIDMLYKAKWFLKKKTILECVYYSYIHTYLN